MNFCAHKLFTEPKTSSAYVVKQYRHICGLGLISNDDEHTILPSNKTLTQSFSKWMGFDIRLSHQSLQITLKGSVGKQKSKILYRSTHLPFPVIVCMAPYLKIALMKKMGRRIMYERVNGPLDDSDPWGDVYFDEGKIFPIDIMNQYNNGIKKDMFDRELFERVMLKITNEFRIYKICNHSDRKCDKCGKVFNNEPKMICVRCGKAWCFNNEGDCFLQSYDAQSMLNCVNVLLVFDCLFQPRIETC